jgi:hypothetical protein
MKKETHDQTERKKNSEARREEMCTKFKWGNILEEKNKIYEICSTILPWFSVAPQDEFWDSTSQAQIFQTKMQLILKFISTFEK